MPKIAKVITVPMRWIRSLRQKNAQSLLESECENDHRWLILNHQEGAQDSNATTSKITSSRLSHMRPEGEGAQIPSTSGHRVTRHQSDRATRGCRCVQRLRGSTPR